MRFDKLTIKAQEAVQDALQQASSAGHAEIGPEHLLASLLCQENGISRDLLARVGANLADLQSEVDSHLGSLPSVRGASAQPGLSALLQSVMDHAFQRAQHLKDDYVSAEHLLEGIVAVEAFEPLLHVGRVREGDG